MAIGGLSSYKGVVLITNLCMNVKKGRRKIIAFVRALFVVKFFQMSFTMISISANMLRFKRSCRSKHCVRTFLPIMNI